MNLTLSFFSVYQQSSLSQQPKVWFDQSRLRVTFETLIEPRVQFGCVEQWNQTTFREWYKTTLKHKTQKKIYTSKANLTHVGNTLLYGANATKTKQTNKHTLNKNNWASNKDGEKCRLFIERENKTKTEHLTSVTWIYYKKK